MPLPSPRPGFGPWDRKIPWRKQWLATPVFLPGEFRGQGSLASYEQSIGHKNSDMTEQLTHKTMGFFVVVVLFHHWSILWEFLHNHIIYEQK